jgi:hypothetical protein
MGSTNIFQFCKQKHLCRVLHSRGTFIELFFSCADLAYKVCNRPNNKGKAVKQEQIAKQEKGI